MSTSNGPRTCLCGQQIPWEESYGPASQVLLKWYEHGQAFGMPSTRRKMYLCKVHTNEIVDYLDALNAGDNVAVIREMK